MIYTVTFNPAIDLIITANAIKAGEVNRAVSEKIFFGGKGINVSIILNELGESTKALGFIAGFTGEKMEAELKKAGINTDFVKLESGFSRINVKIRSDLETDINAQGPKIENSDIEKLLEKLSQIKDGDTIVLAGSIPNTLPDNIYEKILDKLSDKDIKIAVDATGNLLLNVLKYKPFLIKPNKFELGEIFGITIDTEAQITEYAKKLQDMGAKNVLISMASDGAVLLDEFGKIHKRSAASGTIISSVGAGDSMVAAFIAGSKSKDYSFALKLGTAAGGATAFKEGLAKKSEIDEVLKQIK